MSTKQVKFKVEDLSNPNNNLPTMEIMKSPNKSNRSMGEDDQDVSTQHQTNHNYSKSNIQSAYTKANLYDLDSDDDELDFLKKDVDFEDRANYRKAVKNEKATNLKKEYSRKYPIDPPSPDVQIRNSKEEPKIKQKKTDSLATNEFIEK